jgi:outer membrane scaffolding protein for murein synthesis (MipA/OmpV family)
MRLTAGVYMGGRVRAGVYGQMTWSDDKATQSYFGLTPQQSSVSGLPAYDAGAGLRFVQLGLLGETDISDRWMAIWGISAHFLQGDARDSPIVQDTTNWYANAGVVYRF